MLQAKLCDFNLSEILRQRGAEPADGGAFNPTWMVRWARRLASCVSRRGCRFVRQSSAVNVVKRSKCTAAATQ